MSSDVILVIVVGTALAFDFTNGFHDTANVVATSISTGAARPQVAIGVASLLNFVGAFISISVAATVANDVVDAAVITPTIVFAGLIGAIAWNLITWYFGLPSSSSHALIGGVVGSAVAAAGFDAVLADGLVGKVLIPAVIAPILAFVVAGIAIGLVYRIVGKQKPGTVTRGFRYGQIVSGGLLALAHGTNDAQKTMGVITLALIANGTLGANADPPDLGDRRLGDRDRPRHLQRRLADHQNDRHADHQDGRGPGLRLAGAGRPVILASTHFGFPLSTTHVINGGVMGAGAGKRLSAVRWGVAGNIVFAWLLTLPAAAAIGAATYGLTAIFGSGALGPVLVTLLALSLVVAAFARRSRQGAPLPAS